MKSIQRSQAIGARRCAVEMSDQKENHFPHSPPHKTLDLPPEPRAGRLGATVPVGDPMDAANGVGPEALDRARGRRLRSAAGIAAVVRRGRVVLMNGPSEEGESS